MTFLNKRSQYLYFSGSIMSEFSNLINSGGVLSRPQTSKNSFVAPSTDRNSLTSTPSTESAFRKHLTRSRLRLTSNLVPLTWPRSTSFRSPGPSFPYIYWSSRQQYRNVLTVKDWEKATQALRKTLPLIGIL